MTDRACIADTKRASLHIGRSKMVANALHGAVHRHCTTNGSSFTEVQQLITGMGASRAHRITSSSRRTRAKGASVHDFSIVGRELCGVHVAAK